MGYFFDEYNKAKNDLQALADNIKGSREFVLDARKTAFTLSKEN